MIWKNILNLIATSLTLTLHFTIVLAEEIPFVAAPLSAYPSLANPPIKPYDSVALLAIVNLINPPHLKLRRIPARLLDKNYYKSQNDPNKISAKQFKDLPHFDTPTFEDFPQIKQNNISGEINENKISTKENWSSLNESANSNITSTKFKRRLESPVIDKDKQTKPILFDEFDVDTKENTKILGRSAGMQINSKPLPSDYSYNYSVSDEGQKDVKSHSESRNGDVVTGEYSILEPDGYTRVVKYYSSSSSGFKARVIRIAPVKTNVVV